MTRSAFLVSRRAILGGVALAGSAGLLTAAARSAGLPARPLFTLGVASGEPVPDGMVLWTRLAPEPLLGDGGMPASVVPVRWEVAEEPGFSRLAAAGLALAEPRWGHSVHVEASGLKPDRPYWYRFIANGEASPVGRTRTAPLPGAPVERLRFCFGSCQKYEAGHYAAHRAIAAEAPDLILFLGDYIYEGDPAPGDVRMHLNPEPFDVPGYRVRYATYRRDPLLQASHAAAPWAVIWDDHEVANDYAADRDEKNGDTAAFLARRAAAYQVFWEHMPLRRSARPGGGGMRLYRSLAWGDLAEFQLLDDRQYRAPPACQPPELRAQHRRYLGRAPDCAELFAAERSMLGGAQEQWLDARFADARARWNFVAQQTLMAPYPRLDEAHPDAPPTLNSLDTWQGYPAARARLLRALRDHRVANPIVLGGDIHAFVASELPDPDGAERPVAAEFVGGSITSHNHDPLLKRNTGLFPHFGYAENEVRGYASVELRRNTLTLSFQGVRDPGDPHSPVAPVQSFLVETGSPAIQPKG